MRESGFRQPGQLSHRGDRQSTGQHRGGPRPSSNGQLSHRGGRESPTVGSSSGVQDARPDWMKSLNVRSTYQAEEFVPTPVPQLSIPGPPAKGKASKGNRDQQHDSPRASARATPRRSSSGFLSMLLGGFSARRRANEEPDIGARAALSSRGPAPKAAPMTLGMPKVPGLQLDTEAAKPSTPKPAKEPAAKAKGAKGKGRGAPEPEPDEPEPAWRKGAFLGVSMSEEEFESSAVHGQRMILAEVSKMEEARMSRRSKRVAI